MQKQFILKKILLLFFYTISICTAKQNKKDETPSSILVESVPVQKYEFYDEIYAIGECNLESSSEFYAQVPGKLSSVNIKEGQKVKKGQVLITINSDIAYSKKSKAQTCFNNACKIYKNNLIEYEKGFLSEYELKESKSKLDNAKSDLILAMQEYDNMIIKANSNGVIGVINAKVGQNIKKDDYLFSLIQNNSTKQVIVSLPENTYKNITTNSDVFTVDLENNQIKGKIVAISPYLDNNGMLSAKIEFPEHTKILHKSFIQVQILFNKHFNIGVPENSIIKNIKGTFVYKIQDDKVIAVHITTKTRVNNVIEITYADNNLNIGDRIVLKGLSKITDSFLVQDIATTKQSDDNN